LILDGLATKRLDVTFPGRLLFGAGESQKVGGLCRDLGPSRAFLVTDAGVKASGVVDGALSSLEEAELEVSVFDSVSPNPSVSDVEAGSEALRDFGVRDCVVVAVGGGSAMDAAKAVSLHATNGGDVRELDFRNEIRSPGLPLLALPTTSGTGSETNGFGVITDPSNGRKFYVGHGSVHPKASVLDARLTLGLPALATAATGLDALTHALEAAMSKNGNPYADGLAAQVVRMTFEWLPRAVEDGENVEARSQMLLAAHLAGLSFASGTGLGLCHAIAHPVGARVGAPHGAALAAVLPQVMEFNLPASSGKLAAFAAALGVLRPEEEDETNARAFISETRRLIERVLGEPKLSGMGVTGELVPKLVEDAMHDGVISNTPRMPSAEEVEGILTSAL
jgi:alcohol dehydrogenase